VLENYHGTGIASGGKAWSVSGLQADIVLKRLSIRPTGGIGLARFKNGSVTAFMHHNEALCTVRNGRGRCHYSGIIDVISARAKNGI
jgi:hypothetical protein